MVGSTATFQSHAVALTRTNLPRVKEDNYSSSVKDFKIKLFGKSVIFGVNLECWYRKLASVLISAPLITFCLL